MASPIPSPTASGWPSTLTKDQVLDQPAPVIEDDGRECRVTLPLV